MITATTTFLEGLEKWLNAVQAGDFEAARGYARDCRLMGDMLAIHPDFEHCFSKHCKDCEAEEALGYLCQFLECATEARARVAGRQSAK